MLKPLHITIEKGSAIAPEDINGKLLRDLQKNTKVSVAELSRMTHLSRSSIYRAFDNTETKVSTYILLFIALQYPCIFE